MDRDWGFDMKTSIIEDLRQEGYDFHRCAPGEDGLCYYLVSERRGRDYGDKDGRIFKAICETPSGSLSIASTLGFFVSGTAQATQRTRALIGDFDSYVIKAGLAHLRVLVDTYFEGGLRASRKDIELTSNSPIEDFTPPAEPNPLAEQRDLRLQIVGGLALLHSMGKKRVSKDALLEKLCTDPAWVDRALTILGDEKLVDGALRGEMKLTPKGFLEAEKTITSPAPPGDSASPHFDDADFEVPAEAMATPAQDDQAIKPEPLRARPEDKIILSGATRPVTPAQLAPSREALENFIDEWGGFYPDDNVPVDPGNKKGLPIDKETYDLSVGPGAVILSHAPSTRLASGNTRPLREDFGNPESPARHPRGSRRSCRQIQRRDHRHRRGDHSS